MSYLDNAGLQYFWSKIKVMINAKADASDLQTTDGNVSALQTLTATHTSEIASLSSTKADKIAQVYNATTE